MSFRNGVIFQLGLFSLIANLDSGVRQPEHLRNCCVGGCGETHAPSMLRQNKVCVASGKEVPNSEIKKAKVNGSAVTVIEQSEVGEAKEATIEATGKTVALTPHPVEGLRLVPSDSVYYLTPGPGQDKAYSIFHDYVTRHPEVVLMGMFTPVSRTGQYRLGTYGDALVMQSVYHVADLKIAEPNLAPVDHAFAAQIDMLSQALMTPYDPDTYRDRYVEQLADLIASREAVEGVVGERTKSERKTPATVGIDLTAQLAAAVEQAKAAKAPAKTQKRRAS